MKSPFFIVCLVVMLMSCKESKDNSTKEKEVERDTIEKEIEVKIPSNGRTDRDLSQIKFVEQEELIPFLKTYAKENPETIVDVETEFGTFTIELFPEPVLHRANFIRLAKLGYFDTTVFHRVDDDFVVQGGNSDRMSTHQFRGAVGDYLIPNESTPKYPHDYGMVSAAKYAEQNVSNASSPFEFFVVTKPNGAYHLDGDHTVFGKVIKGMNVVEKIDDLETDDSEWPLTNVGLDIKVVR
ncbi:peptidylprolyl isomerase [Psychroflexus sp. CAK57W]|uniref:peptidylprolyl isomerase n=1 Tax=Psychroflexus curvus TaxID=2873595 RepID=UPI001CC95646|nr:peptidylprolyl isomerase [Psychroflexus curvus]MBZ9628605.1 peptidylprolyl isomerase [Psychroflexus curvus]MBZ9787948.1 peptidylprolyl isomerase [Psychroflexus curvus]